jgi:hypothetical protein
MAVTLRVETPWTYLSATAIFSARSLCSPFSKGRRIELDAPGLEDGHGERAELGADGLGLEAVGMAGALLGPLAGHGTEGIGAHQFHDLVEQDGDGLGHADEAVLGQEFHDLVESGNLDLVGHRRSGSLCGFGSPPRKRR